MKLRPLVFVATLSLILPLSCYSQKTVMTFNVDMKPAGLPTRDTTLNVTMRGSIEPLNWGTGIQMTDDDRDGVYSTTIVFDNRENQELIFKYVLNGYEWEVGENVKIEIKKGAQPYHSSFRYMARPGNPFRKFIGEWTLKDDNWEQGYGQDRERIKVPNHHTRCREVNTDNSILCVIDAPSSKGHIFWAYNHGKKEAQWSSSFYSFRSGLGSGSVNNNGDLIFKVSFEGEPEGTYGLYTYKWITEDEYEMKSVQYNDKGEPTGGFYGGTFVRVNKNKITQK